MPEDGKLHISSIDLINFRNYKDARFVFNNSNILLIGDNAVGKTTLLEAICLLTGLKSFRTNKHDQLVSWGESQSAVTALIEGGERLLEMKLVVDEGQRQYFLNSKRKTIKDLTGMLPAVTFTPDDLFMVKGSSEKRRAFVDNLGSQLSKNYYLVHSDYRKLVKQKNAALKQEEPQSVIDGINEVLAKVGGQFYRLRIDLLDRLVPLIEEYFAEITDGKEKIELVYTPSWSDGEHFATKEEANEALFAAIEANKEAEREAQRVTIGPHKDAISFLISGNDAQQYASQGQQRSIVLACKIAEIELVQQTLGQKPVLLLDDVMSELDEKRRAAFMKQVKNTTQTFITATNIGYFNQETLDNSEILYLGDKSSS